MYIKNRTLTAIRLSMTVVFLALSAFAQDLKTADIIAKHLDSIASKEKRVEIKNQLAAGTSNFESRLPVVNVAGKAVIVSDRQNLFYVSSFSSREYQFEKVGFFSGKPSLPFISSGRRSPLGAFIADHAKMLSDGLFTGTMSARWALFDLEDLNTRFKSSGTKKIDGRRMYVLEYFPRGVGTNEFTTHIYIDAETFRHTRTEYRHEIAAWQDTFGQLGRQAGVKLRLFEIFDDYKTVDGITLPYSYRIEYQTDSNSGVYEYFWGIKVQQYLFNQNLAADFFTFDEK